MVNETNTADDRMRGRMRLSRRITNNSGTFRRVASLLLDVPELTEAEEKNRRVIHYLTHLWTSTNGSFGVKESLTKTWRTLRIVLMSDYLI